MEITQTSFILFVGTTTLLLLIAGIIFFFVKAFTFAKERDIAYFVLLTQQDKLKKSSTEQIAEITFELQGRNPGPFNPKFIKLSAAIEQKVAHGYERIRKANKLR